MDSFTLSTTANSSSFSAIQFFTQPIFHAKKSGVLNFPRRKPRRFCVSASKDEPQLDEWDKMELKFGRMIGEDPKITLAKIMGRKSNPDVSYLEIEKLLDKKKGGVLDEGIEEVPFDLSDQTKSTKSVQGLNLVRPVLKKGTKFETTDKPVETNAKSSIQPIKKVSEETKSSVPDVILRKPRSFNEDDSGSGKSTMFGMRPNLSLRMGKEPQKERFSDISLLRKPEPMTTESEFGEENSRSGSSDSKAGMVDKIKDKILRYGISSTEGRGSAPLLQKPELMMKLDSNTEAGPESPKEQTDLSSSNDITENKSDVSNLYNQQVTTTDINHNLLQETGKQESVSDEGLGTELQADMWSGGKTFSTVELSRSTPAVSMDTVLIGKPKRLDRSVKPEDQKIKDEAVPINPQSLGNSSDLENFLTTSPIKEREDDDWARAAELVKTGEREEVELISASTKGFVASFGSLIGFLPYRNLAARWKFLAFESWLKRKGLDPSHYRQNLGIIGKYEATSMMDTSESVINSEIGSKTDGAITSDMKLEDLLMIYDQEKLKFLSSFVGQRINVGLVLADRNSRRLIFSIKPKEKEELVEKKRSLMARLSVGDVVKCCIKKITYFGVFVEVEGVPALIHQTEVSWDATLDPASYFKVGQIVDAKVHQLDFLLERIFLSLKEITPDPLMEALEAVVGDNNSLDGILEAAQADSEWADVESLIKELEQFDGIQSVSKGRYFLSPGLAPTFQVYMASMFENQYKLLARAGNRVQEVMVQTSLSKEELKSAILTCTNRVE
ncbi:Nucleic acid-binding [Perilla frutescens var. hirtella]|uniref:Nucleic acid-binding n=1 Tax=Perilla frutescens var. hirtella TaxID=608512 RepID=A0AAD4ILZ7_PERFH|nr:Nucleic acid-binding [Perilla frutescens var. hirtella]